ncbi:MAG: hypothetical protein ACTSRP_25655 [Candidatus Helarchaeota archaeon]
MWWENYNLKKEPNFTVHPLIGNDLKLFVRCEDSHLNEKIFKRLNNPNNFYHKIFGMLGEFGSGKTTLANYISSKLCENSNILYIKTNLRPIEQIKNIQEMRNIILSEIYYKLSQKVELFKTLKINNNDRLEGLEDLIFDIFKILSPQYDGFFIFIDELHRILEYEYILNFFKFEQGFFEDIISSFNIFFLISGREEWSDKLKLPDYSGIFTEIIYLPNWSHYPNSAYELIEKRLKEVAINPNNFEMPIAFDAIETLLKTVKNPREILKSVKELFEKTSGEKIDSKSLMTISSIVSNRQLDIIKDWLTSPNYEPVYKRFRKFVGKKPQDIENKIYKILNYIYL